MGKSTVIVVHFKYLPHVGDRNTLILDHLHTDPFPETGNGFYFYQLCFLPVTKFKMGNWTKFSCKMVKRLYFSLFL